MKDLIQKYRMKYPSWLFKWLIKKHWLFPEPMVFSDMLVISQTMQMAIAPQAFKEEIFGRLIENMWDAIETAWLKYSYTPQIRDIILEKNEDFMGNTTLRWRMVCNYSHHRTFNYMDELVDKIRRRIVE